MGKKRKRKRRWREGEEGGGEEGRQEGLGGAASIKASWSYWTVTRTGKISRRPLNFSESALNSPRDHPLLPLGAERALLLEPHHLNPAPLRVTEQDGLGWTMDMRFLAALLVCFLGTCAPTVQAQGTIPTSPPLLLPGPPPPGSLPSLPPPAVFLADCTQGCRNLRDGGGCSECLSGPQLSVLVCEAQ